jgi:phosphoribosyl 1,2-cyclic phosphodiesterase
MGLSFCSLSSGSSGNCYYIGNVQKGILIDAGISSSAIRRYLRELDIPLQSIMGVLVSHNHIDHIRGLRLLAVKNNLPVYTTQKIKESILVQGNDSLRYLIREIPLLNTFDLAGFEIEAFPVCHDAPETIGFHVCCGDRKITIATDLGHICEVSASYIRKSDFIVIESNYDEEMLRNGGYPYFLKSRIASDHGHLGNRQTSEFLAENFTENISHICLAHLSRNNNTPFKALETIEQTFSERGIFLNGKTRITVLDRDRPGNMIML